MAVARSKQEQRAGLCDSCAHTQVITSSHGSVFHLCRLSFTDPRFPRYPPLPVLQCVGYEPRVLNPESRAPD